MFIALDDGNYSNEWNNYSNEWNARIKINDLAIKAKDKILSSKHVVYNHAVMPYKQAADMVDYSNYLATSDYGVCRAILHIKIKCTVKDFILLFSSDTFCKYATEKRIDVI